MFGFFSTANMSLVTLVIYIVCIALIIFLAIAFLTGSSLRKQLSKLGLSNSNFFRGLQNQASSVDRDIESLVAKTRIKRELWKGYWRSWKALFGIGVGDVPESFLGTSEILRFNISGDGYLYRVPWYLAVGESESGKTSVLENIPLIHPVQSPQFGYPHENPALNWWFFEKGIIVDVGTTTFYAGKNSYKGGDWASVLSNLNKYRKEKPLDGIILTVSAKNFVGKEKRSIEENKLKAKEVSDRIAEAEKKLGLRLPVYIIITCCDTIGGFEGFAKEESTESRGRMLGWSNPYSTNLSFTDIWIDEAFDKISEELFIGSANLFSRSHDVKYKDELMVLPEEFLNIRDGVKSYLNSVLYVPGYEDHFLFRGIYFTGNSKAAKEIASPFSVKEASTNPNEKSKVTLPFLKDLFEKKIFKEVGLAKPIEAAFKGAQRHITYAKIVFTIIFLGLSFSLYKGTQDVKYAVSGLKPALFQIEKDIHIISTQDKKDPILMFSAQAAFFQKRAHGVLNLMVKVAEYPIKTSWLPISWFSRLESRTYEDVGKIYDLFIAKPMYLGFVNRARQITKAPIPELPPLDSKKFLSPLDTPQFITLEGYVDALQMLEDRLNVYSNLRETGGVEELEKVASYLYNYSFPQEFLENPSHFTTHIIKEAKYQPFDLNNYRIVGEKRLFELYDSFLKRILNPKYTNAIAAKLQSMLQNIDEEGLPSLEQFHKTLAYVRSLTEFISSPDTGWISKAEFDPGNRFQNTMAKILGLKIFNNSVARRLEQLSEKVYERAQGYLKSFGSPLTGHFFTLSAVSGHLVPSSGLKSLQSGLEDFLNLPFMAKTDGDKFRREIPDGKILLWDAQLVQNAITLLQAFKEFVDDDISTYPADLQEILRTIARDQTFLNVEDMLSRAQDLKQVPEITWGKDGQKLIREQIANLKQVGTPLINIVKALDNADSTTILHDLKSLIFKQMYAQLKQIDEIMEDSGFFDPMFGDFSSWKGDEDSIFAAFDVVDKFEMQSYFTNQMQRFEEITSDFAVPVVKFLTSDVFAFNISQIKLVDKWQRIIKQVDSFQKHKPTSSASILEKFLLAEGNKITYKNCFSSINPKTFGKSGDYFVQKKNALLKNMYKRCEEIAAQKAYTTYTKLANFFNAYMSNAFPFSVEIADQTDIGTEVSDGTLLEFFKLFDKLTPDMHEAMDKFGGYGESWKKAQTFMAKMAKVRDFFDLYFAPSHKGAAAGMNFDIEFRENRAHEKNGSMVMSWAFVYGKKTLTQSSLKKEGRWIVGDEAAFGFQWAKNSNMFPLSNSQNPALAYTGGRSIFLYEGQWSLLRAMLLHKTDARDGGTANDNSLLKFEIPLASSPDANSPSESAVLYVRVTPKTKQGIRALHFKVPEFPIEAPTLEKDAESE